MKYKRYNSLGEEELNAVVDVMRSGVLSEFIGAECAEFYGGKYVRELEFFAKELFNVKHAIAVNSWTSGLICAVGALGLEPGTEVITTPWTMSATALSILHWNLIPVFVDINENDFCITPETILPKITKNTKAIVVADIFGKSCDIRSIMELADKYGLKVICDTAQSPMARIKGQNAYAGCVSHIGGISFNYHKHIHCGEGGIIFTNDDFYANKMMKIRNHGENIISQDEEEDLINNLGFNFRLGEMEAAIAIEQLKKLPNKIHSRISVANKITQGLHEVDGIRLPAIETRQENVFYVYPIILTSQRLIENREKIIANLKKAGLTFVEAGYVMVNRLPVFQKKIAYGKGGFPWTLNDNNDLGYSLGDCPIGDYLQDSSFLELNICMYEFHDHEIEHLIQEMRNELLSY